MSKEEMLKRLKKYREQDPNFEKAIKAFAEAEAKIDPKDDPAEGKVVIGKLIDGKIVKGPK